ncbi:ARL14 effector protein-like [Trichogramma pretiosum]|uniref:ARL14 effector protein-like n=1 Tax=Trichogramma pretiosum TaxID=7493 RepID=UPI0006C9887F|nr:ARL14 effector protein-like [Trichogramma pretiosum]
MSDQPRQQRATRGAKQNVGAKQFLGNFDPEQSEREKRKLNRRLTSGPKKASVYDENGYHIATGQDLCDCLDSKCAGCHCPCPKCSSKKCGHECRVGRKYMYESIENEGSDQVTRNPTR